jgi:hypothetical protein
LGENYNVPPYDKDINFRGIHFATSLHMDKFIFCRSANFDYATFKWTPSFKHATFTGTAWFGHATFTGKGLITPSPGRADNL